MEHTAQQNRKNILITDIASYLGKSLAEYFLSRNHHVYGLTKSLAKNLPLSHKNFTLLDLDLNQPLPSHLPQFDLICFQLAEDLPDKEFQSYYNLPSELVSVLAYSKDKPTRLFVFTPISQNANLQDTLTRDLGNSSQASLFLVGDLFGPEMDLKEKNEFAQIISQSVITDKIVLENDGKNHIYPAYIYDVTAHIGKSLIGKPNPVEFLVSQEPKTTLDIAYEIQKIAYYNNQKDLGLFFSGPKAAETQKPPIRVHTIPAATSLDIGLKNTLNYFEEHHKLEKEKNKEQIAWVPPRKAPLPDTIPTLSTNQEPTKIKTLKVKKPRRIIPRTPLKFFSGAVAIFLVIFIGKALFDVFMGINFLANAKSKITSSDLKKASAEAKSAASSLNSAQLAVNTLLYPFSFVLPQQTTQIKNVLSASQKTASSIEALTLAAQSLNQNLITVSSESATQQALDLETPVIHFQKAYSQSSQAHELLENASSLGVFTKQTTALRDANEKSAQIAKQGEAITHLLPHLTGAQEPKTYLLLLQNNAELRPGGGFIGNIGLLEFENGHLKNISVDDVYNLDGQLKEKIDPPKQLAEKLGVDNFYLRDSNWSGDFQLNAQTARDFYKKVTGKSVDGVIAFDLTLMQNLLRIIGPIKLDDYNEQITGDNLFERGEFYSEIGFFPGSTQKRDFFGSLSKNLISTLISSLTNPSASAKGLAILEAVHDGVLEKHLMFNFDDTDLASYLTVNDLDRTLPPTSFDPTDDGFETRDFISLSEANIGANKVNRYVERKAEYELTVGRDADLVGKLTVTYTNNSQAETWPGGKYSNYLRVYLPAGTSLEDYSQEPLPEESTQSAKTKPKIPPTTDENTPVQVTTQGNLTVFSKYIEVPVKSSKTVSFTYRIHKNIKLETAPTYHLYVQKQPGTEKDPFTLRFNLPNYLVAKSINNLQQPKPLQNFQIETDLATDRQFEVEISKK